MADNGWNYEFSNTTFRFRASAQKYLLGAAFFKTRKNSAFFAKKLPKAAICSHFQTRGSIYFGFLAFFSI